MFIVVDYKSIEKQNKTGFFKSVFVFTETDPPVFCILADRRPRDGARPRRQQRFYFGETGWGQKMSFAATKINPPSQSGVAAFEAYGKSTAHLFYKQF